MISICWILERIELLGELSLTFVGSYAVSMVSHFLILRL
nr:MAG TPA: hypothetical protein [Caudoviricetes sp.]